MAQADDVVLLHGNAHGDEEEFSLVPIGYKPTCVSWLGLFCGMLFVIPIYFVFLLMIAVISVSGIGPIIEACCSRSEKKLTDRHEFARAHPETRTLEIPAGTSAASGPYSYRIAYRWVVPADGGDLSLPPVVLPNGLAATQLALARVQDELASMGYSSLSFDRLGTGFSDDNPTSIPASAFDMAREMEYLMRAVLPEQEKWIGIGASMGQICIEAYMVVFPDRFSAILNLDGLPYGFVRTSKQYLKTFAPMYSLLGILAYTGVMRVLMNVAAKPLIRKLKSAHIDPAISLAQMKQPRFWFNAKLEFFTMLSCAELSNAGWGEFSVLKMESRDLAILASAQPRASAIIDETKGIERTEVGTRSASELGMGWASAAQVKQSVDRLRARAAAATNSTVDVVTSFSDLRVPACGKLQGGIPLHMSARDLHPLAPQWASLVVRTMGMRSYDMGDGIVGKKAYSQDQRNWSAAGQSLHVLLALDGARTVYPELTHSEGFAQSKEIASLIREMTGVLNHKQ